MAHGSQNIKRSSPDAGAGSQTQQGASIPASKKLCTVAGTDFTAAFPKSVLLAELKRQQDLAQGIATASYHSSQSTSTSSDLTSPGLAGHVHVLPNPEQPVASPAAPGSTAPKQLTLFSRGAQNSAIVAGGLTVAGSAGSNAAVGPMTLPPITTNPRKNPSSSLKNTVSITEQACKAFEMLKQLMQLPRGQRAEMWAKAEPQDRELMNKLLEIKRQRKLQEQTPKQAGPSVHAHGKDLHAALHNGKQVMVSANGAPAKCSPMSPSPMSPSPHAPLGRRMLAQQQRQASTNQTKPLVNSMVCPSRVPPYSSEAHGGGGGNASPFATSAICRTRAADPSCPATSPTCNSSSTAHGLVPAFSQGGRPAPSVCTGRPASTSPRCISHGSLQNQASAPHPPSGTTPTSTSTRTFSHSFFRSNSPASPSCPISLDPCPSSSLSCATLHTHPSNTAAAASTFSGTPTAAACAFTPAAKPRPASTLPTAGLQSGRQHLVTEPIGDPCGQDTGLFSALINYQTLISQSFLQNGLGTVPNCAEPQSVAWVLHKLGFDVLGHASTSREVVSLAQALQEPGPTSSDETPAAVAAAVAAAAWSEPGAGAVGNGGGLAADVAVGNPDLLCALLELADEAAAEVECHAQPEGEARGGGQGQGSYCTALHPWCAAGFDTYVDYRLAMIDYQRGHPQQEQQQQAAVALAGAARVASQEGSLASLSGVHQQQQQQHLEQHLEPRVIVQVPEVFPGCNTPMSPTGMNSLLPEGGWSGGINQQQQQQDSDDAMLALLLQQQRHDSDDAMLALLLQDDHDMPAPQFKLSSPFATAAAAFPSAAISHLPVFEPLRAATATDVVPAPTPHPASPFDAMAPADPDHDTMYGHAC